MDHYVRGNGHADLANLLGINQIRDLSESGASNDRIIRTTFEDSLIANPSLYVLGTTFFLRQELSLSTRGDHWESVKLGSRVNYLPPHVSQTDVQNYIKLGLKFNQDTMDAHVELLFYRLIMLIDSLQSRGHKVLVFNTAEKAIFNTSFCDRKLFKDRTEIIDSLCWLSIPYQFEKGARYLKQDEQLDPNLRHVAPGEHKQLNNFLLDYIKKESILHI